MIRDIKKKCLMEIGISGSDRETRVYIKVAYSENPSTDLNNNPKLLLWNFYKKYAICSLENGRYQTIAINEA